MPRLLAVLLCLITAVAAPAAAQGATRAPAKKASTAAKKCAPAKKVTVRRASVRARRAMATPVRRVTVRRSVTRTPARRGVVRRCTTTTKRVTKVPAASSSPAPATTETTTTTVCSCVPAAAGPPAPSAPAAVASPPAPPAAPGGLRFGLVAGVHFEAAWQAPDATLDALRTAGVTTLREQFQWSVIEPQRGSYNWTRFDRLYTSASRRGITILPLLFSPPSWAAPTWNTLPDPDLYAQFAATVAKRYGPGGSFWAAHPELPASGASSWFELWNEPYEIAFSKGGVDPARYARLVKAAGAAIHAASPSAKVLMAMTHKSYGGVPWVDAVYDAVPDLSNYYDGIAQHPYSPGQSYDDPENWFKRDMEGIRQRMLAHGAGDKPTQITEIGWPTCPGTDPRCVTEARQAADLRRVVQEIRTKYPWVAAIHVYQQKDNKPASQQNPDDSEGWYGLQRNDGTPKPAWSVFTELATAAG